MNGYGKTNILQPNLISDIFRICYKIFLKKILHIPIIYNLVYRFLTCIFICVGLSEKLLEIPVRH